jgi:hypothetical protein
MKMLSSAFQEIFYGLQDPQLEHAREFAWLGGLGATPRKLEYLNVNTRLAKICIMRCEDLGHLP